METTRRTSRTTKLHTLRSGDPQPMTQTIYLVKDNDQLVSFCSCERAYVTYPPQRDCPGCGCGWLFTCTNCRKAFTFARGVELEQTWEQLARRDLVGRRIGAPSREDVARCVKTMQTILWDVEVGRQYVCLDGLIIRADAPGVDLRGWYADHRHAFVPQTAALDDSSVVENILSNVEYWRSNTVRPRRRRQKRPQS